MRRIVEWIAATILFLAASPCDALAQTLRAFTVADAGTGDLHGWPEVSGTDLVGLDAADGICRARAFGAGLDDAADYVAWLSDRDDDAYCRVFGLTGKKADRCGAAELPTKAGPWLRTDGTPFAATIDAMTEANVVYSTLDVDELGLPLTAPLESFTATDASGAFDTEFARDADCERWTSAADGRFATTGWNFTSSEGWTEAHTGVTCASARHLMCLQRGSRAAPRAFAPSGRREAFVTSANVTGNLGGVAGADATCRALAANAGLYRPDTFKALIASSSSNIDAIARFEIDGPWYRRDGFLFAHGKSELASGLVTVPLNVTERGDYVGFAGAPTGADVDGSPSPGDDCADWTGGGTRTPAALVNGTQGPDRGWLAGARVGCGTRPPNPYPLKLMCLADVDVLFHAQFD